MTSPPDEMPEFGPPEGPGTPDSGGAPAPRRRVPRGDLNLPRRYSRWAMWGCLTLVLVVLLVVGGFLLVTMRQAGFGTWVKFAENVAACRGNLEAVSGALGRYHADQKTLPGTLEDLSPTYMADDRHLRCPADTAQGAGTSYVYLRPKAWGTGRNLAVYCPHHPAPGSFAVEPNQEPIHQIPMMLEDGSVDVATARLADLLKKDNASPERARQER